MTTYTSSAELPVNAVTFGGQTPNYHGHTVAGLIGGGFVNVWETYAANASDGTVIYDIVMQRFDNFGNAVGAETQVNAVSGATNSENHILPQVNFLAGGGYVVVWTSYGQDGGGGDNGGGGIYFQQYDASGNKVGGETLANTTTKDEQDTPSVIGLPDGGYVITWDSFGQDGDRYGEYGQRFSATGAKVGSEFHISTSTAGTQDSSSLSLYDGGLVVVYNSATTFDTNGNATNYDIMMQRFDDTGAPVGTETRVNTTTAGNQYFSSVTPAVDLSGKAGFIVAWVSNDGATSQIHTQRFDHTGAPLLSEATVNTTSTGDAEGVSISVLSDGGYVVAWSEDDGTGTNYDVFAQRFDVFGNKVGTQTMIDTVTAGNEVYPSVALLSDGSYVITYRGPDASANGIYQKIFYIDQTINDSTAGGHSLTGGYGSDVIHGNDGDDTLDGGGGPGLDTLYGDAGNDTIFIQGGDKAYGGDGDDVIKLTHLNGLNIYLEGGAGYDILDATASDYAPGWGLTNGQSIEEYRASSHGDTVDASTVTNVPVFTFTGGAGNDTVKSGSGADILNGGGGNDYIDGGTGADTMTGGVGDDTYVVDNANDKVIEVAGGGTDTIQTAMNYTLAANFENLILTGTADLTGTGNGAVNHITGNDGNNLLNGMANADIMAGGKGNDTYVVDAIGDQVIEAAGGGTDLVQASVTYTLAANVENLALTGTAAINGTGNGADNVLTGNSGANILTGLEGNDYIDGGAGADQMKGGAGDDTYVVDNINDKITEANGGGTDTVMSSVDFVIAGYVENVTLTGTANIKAVGNGEDNTLIGNAGNNLINGGQGADTMTGGAGNDTYYVDNVNDKILEKAGEGTDIVYSAVTYTLPDNVETLILNGYNAINATGNALGNTITGNGAANIINGGDGNDVLRGLGGNDTLTGGAGADSFVFQAPGGNNGLDHITDFVSGTDKLIFHAADFGFTAGHHLTDAEFHVGGRVGTNGQFIYNTATHTLYWDPDGTGSQAAASIAVFDNGVTLHNTDFGFV